MRQYKLQLSDMQKLRTKLSHFRKCTRWLHVRLLWLRSLFMKKSETAVVHSLLSFLCRVKKGLCLCTYDFFFSLFLPSFISPWPRSGVAMPFSCLAIGEKKDYNNPSDVTDKYDLGQIVKSWVSQPCSSLVLIWSSVDKHRCNSVFQGGVLWDF